MLGFARVSNSGAARAEPSLLFASCACAAGGAVSFMRGGKPEKGATSSRLTKTAMVYPGEGGVGKVCLLGKGWLSSMDMHR